MIYQIKFNFFGGIAINYSNFNDSGYPNN